MYNRRCCEKATLRFTNRRTNKQCDGGSWTIHNTGELIGDSSICSRIICFYASMPCFLHDCRLKNFLLLSFFVYKKKNKLTSLYREFKIFIYPYRKEGKNPTPLKSDFKIIFSCFLTSDDIFSIALAVLLDFLLQITAFVALVTLDFVRTKDNRIDCFPCIKLNPSSMEQTEGAQAIALMDTLVFCWR